MPSSLYLFQFRLLPWEACSNLNFENLPLSRLFTAVCTRDLLGLLGAYSGTKLTFNQLQRLAVNHAVALVNAHAYAAYPSFPALDIESVNWVEVKNSRKKPVVYGYAHHSLARVPLIPGHSDTEPFLQAGQLVRDAFMKPGVGQALSDFHAACRDLSTYFAFYAYRVLEDIGYSFGQKNDRPDWDAMNQALGTTPQHWKPLTDSSVATRHLNPLASPPSPTLLAQRQRVLDLAKDALHRWFEYLAL